ncbi:MAG: hypothetical protein A2X49_01155 [Lentisphaerae bacterium GWF2_52_8]|nr:MAG: hypothetical protein A2X49_01155 [Lentisphaerae bacterium GWF2_52_8]
MKRLRLDQIIKSFHGKRIAVLGDLILDVYAWGKVSRISPEAPVPVVRVKNTTYSLGGAANVMRNIVTLGGKVCAFGIVGEDAKAAILRQQLADYGIEASSVLADSSRRTTEKQRIVAGSQQVVRIDYEDTGHVRGDLMERLLGELLRLVHAKEIDAIIFEDYNKGVIEKGMIQKITAAARENGIMTALDPHPGQRLEVKGLSVLKPNRAEAFELAGVYQKDPSGPPEKDESLHEVAAKLFEIWEPEWMLITMGPQGMALFGKDGSREFIPTKAREVFDVSGAGDTVVSAFTLALASGASAREAAEIANHAAGVVVGKVGTVSVTTEELVASFEAEGLK